jgi:hypothetical protein
LRASKLSGGEDGMIAVICQYDGTVRCSSGYEGALLSGVGERSVGDVETKFTSAEFKVCTLIDVRATAELGYRDIQSPKLISTLYDPCLSYEWPSATWLASKYVRSFPRRCCVF